MTDNARTYSVHGLVIRSEVPLGEEETSSSRFDLDVRRGPEGPADVDTHRLISETNVLGRTWHVSYAYSDGYLLRLPSLSDFLISSDLRSVEVRPAPSIDDEAISLLLMGTVLSFVLMLRGHCVLHAGSVAIDGRAMALAGVAGAGKSTYTALLCSQGALLMADDLLRVELGRPPAAWRGASSIRLRRRAAAVIDLFSPRPAIRETYDDRLAIYPPRADQPVLPLAAVVLPRPNKEIDRVRLHPVTGADAIMGLTLNLRLLGWRTPEHQRQQFEQLGQLRRSVPIYRAQIPWTEPISAAVGEELLDVLAREIAR